MLSLRFSLKLLEEGKGSEVTINQLLSTESSQYVLKEVSLFMIYLFYEILG